MTRPRTPYWRAAGWVAASYALASAITAAIVLGIGAGTIR